MSDLLFEIKGGDKKPRRNDTVHQKIAKVAVHLSLDKSYDYSIPDELVWRVKPGVQVNVVFGHSTRRAYVVALADFSERSDLKPIESVCDDHPEVPESLIRLAEWMARYYCCSKEQAIRTLLPGAVRSGKIKKKTLAHFFISDPDKAEKFILEHAKKSKLKTAALKELLMNPGSTAESLKRNANVNPPTLKALIEEGLLTKEDKIIQRDHYENVEILPTQPLELGAEQKSALDTIVGMMEKQEKTPPHVMLLYGVTGSGKTEVYLQAIARALEIDKDSIVLVPEISLTPQTVERFRARFGNKVSVLHSGLSDGERYDEWMKVHEGKVKIAVGARSALFAPFRKLGLIIVDEEHENSYKQSEAPRYNARDVAVMRGLYENAAVILGSATPSFESFNNAKNGKYILSTLMQRADNKVMPLMKVVDTKLGNRPEEGETGGGSSGYFSQILIHSIKARLEAGEQTILFLNKRGFARQMMCDQCGFVATCPDCSVPYTYHKKRETLVCHLCGAIIPAYNACPQCNSPEIRYSGVGTERVESIARAIFQHARIARMDSDTMTSPDLYEEVLTDFKQGNIDILIGTQMIAKGLHFPNVTLVGVVNADQSLFIPDFRAEERTFQLLTQVGGRAGRGDQAGEVIIQTAYPFNPAIEFAKNHDFDGFFKTAMESRKELMYPPC